LVFGVLTLDVAPKRRSTMFSLVELKAATLDYGIPGISQTPLLLIFLMMLGISMIPYFFLYLSLGDKKSEASTKHAGKFATWLHAHRHPLLNH
jgi:hypothetical protein